MYDSTLRCGPNDGGIKRGDSAETGDEQAQPNETMARDGYGLDNLGPGADSDLEDLNILDADDPTLGLTNVGGKPAEDWAADTGPTRSNEEMDRATKE